jgi:lambda family phage portal protein
MPRTSTILGADGRPYHVPVRRHATRSYEAALDTNDNRKRWTLADAASADALADTGTRATLRNRSRYERRNNSYVQGIALTVANDTVGTGPRLQMLTDDATLNTTIEQAWREWADEVNLAEKLRTMRSARMDAGEAFAVIGTNPGLAHDVQLDVTLREAEEVSDPQFAGLADPLWNDGIRYDPYGNAVSYRVLRHHPGAMILRSLLEFDDIDSRWVLHYYRPDRPGQRRGIPDLTPALGIFMELRRFCEATIAAAETSANPAAVLETGAPPDPDGVQDAAGTQTTDGSDSAPVYRPMDLVEMVRRSFLVLPAGYKMGQIRSEHPATTYQMFVDAKLREAARALNVPFTIAALDSSKSNLSAAYLDHQTYSKSIRIDRQVMERLLNRLFREWLLEAMRMPWSRRVAAMFPHEWYWDAIGEHADPAKVANAQAARLANNTTTLADEYASRGKDWEAQLRQKAKEAALMRELGLSPAQAAPASQDDADEEEDEDGDEEATEPQRTARF